MKGVLFVFLNLTFVTGVKLKVGPSNVWMDIQNAKQPMRGRRNFDYDTTTWPDWLMRLSKRRGRRNFDYDTTTWPDWLMRLSKRRGRRNFDYDTTTWPDWLMRLSKRRGRRNFDYGGMRQYSPGCLVGPCHLPRLG